MALLRNIRSRAGFDASEAYSYIKAVEFDYDERVARITVHTYKDKKTKRTRSADPMDRKVYAVTGDDFRDLVEAVKVDNPRKAGYNFLKSRRQDFATASDDE